MTVVSVKPGLFPETSPGWHSLFHSYWYMISQCSLELCSDYLPFSHPHPNILKSVGPFSTSIVADQLLYSLHLLLWPVLPGDDVLVNFLLLVATAWDYQFIDKISLPFFTIWRFQAMVSWVCDNLCCVEAYIHQKHPSRSGQERERGGVRAPLFLESTSPMLEDLHGNPVSCTSQDH